MMDKKSILLWVKKLLPFILLPFFSLALLFLIEFTHRGSFTLTVKWFIERRTAAIYTVIILTAIYYLLLLLRRKIFIVLFSLFNIFIFTLATVSHIKQSLRGDPLLPIDVTLISESMNMSESFNIMSGRIIMSIVAVLILLAVSGFLLFWSMKTYRYNIYTIVLSVASAIILGYFVNNLVQDGPTSLNQTFKLAYLDYDQRETYKHNGFTIGFLRNTKWLTTEPPEDYSKTTIESLVTEINSDEKAESTTKPNIIFIMSEAFWDPTRLENLSFNKDPIQNFRSLQESNVGGNVLTPVFGGSTANTEFEALTSMSMNFLPTGSIPYLYNLNKPIPSLPFALKEQGYETTAIHSFHNWFYGRNSVYKQLGFDRFISLEFIPNPVEDMYFLRDNEMTDLILNQVKDSDEPNFIFAVSIQGHGPYPATGKKPYANVEIDKEKSSANLESDSENIVETFGDTMSEVDKELARLVQGLEDNGEDSVVVFFGDHLPLLGENYKAYREAGYFEENGSFEEYKKMYETPLLIWDNISDEKESVELSAPFLGPYVLNKYGLKGNIMTDQLTSMMESGTSYIPRQDFIKETKISEEDLKNYNLLQYDILFGEKYGYDPKDLKPNPKYRLGYADPYIEKAEVKKMNGETYVEVHGKNLTKRSSLFIDDTVIEATVDPKTQTITAKIKEEDINKKVQIKINDSLDRTLATSNKVSITK
ncbi:LTA synthase family protein [Bacillus sp. ISL-37]|uniref:LTA synthase family protein n=1 Tax=Bacillus sp. ISL-37 TaxID=2819123 RepID=UPI001BEBD722|nr:LTA synthase family protein [Bacillus sp. ISL-37]MBT2685474.1 LTA synthase family protein [Bacillus sp. ISL-37]